MNPYLALTRPGNMILTAVAVIAGAFIAAGPEIMDFQIEVAICCLCSMMLVGGGNALNDYNDRETDKENHPERPIPSGSISADRAIVCAQALLALGLLILLLALDNPMPFAVAMAGIILLIAYENGLKAAGIIGNIVVGLMSGAVFLFAGGAVDEPGATLWMFGLAVLATITREIVKDIQDLEGDTDRRTLPSSIGIENSMMVAIVTLLIAIGLSYIAMGQFDDRASDAYLGGITLANGTMLFGIYNARQEDYFSGQKNIKQGMGIAMLAFIAAAGLS